MVYHRVKFLFLWEIPMQNMRTTSFEAITWWPIEISVKFQKRLIGNQGSPIGWSRDQLISGGHVTYFLETRSRYSTKMWHISVTDGDIGEIPKATNRKSGVADRMVTWPLISGGHVTYFLETRSRYSTKMWRISVTDGDIGEIPKATNRKSGVADRMVTWPVISGGHVTYFLETRSRYSTKMWHISVTDGDISEKTKSYFSPISMLGNSRVIFHVVTAITLLSLIRNIKQQILMQKLLRSSNMSCSKPFITLLKQQISNCCSGKKYTGNAMHCLCT